MINYVGYFHDTVSQRGYGATVARLTPDPKVGSSNLSGLISSRRIVASCLSILTLSLPLFPSHILWLSTWFGEDWQSLS